MKELRNKLDKIVSKQLSNWVEKTEWRIKNEVWLDYSAKIALRILRRIRELKITQKELAVMLNVSPQQISKLLKGSENLTLETIGKLEKVLNMQLIVIPEFEVTILLEPNSNINNEYSMGEEKTEVLSYESKQYVLSDDCKVYNLAI